MICLRLAGAEDVEVLARLNRPVQDLHVAHRPEYFKQPDERRVADWFRATLENPAVCAWIAESDGVAVGYVLAVVHEKPETAFGYARRFCEIDQIGVTAEFRRRGVARALVERVLEGARVRGINEVELSSWHFNREAHAAFRALGFEEKVVRFGRYDETEGSR